MSGSDAAPALLRGIDRAAFAVALATRLRSRGSPVGFTAIEDLVRALRAVSPDSRSRLYWVCRISLVRRHPELEVFDAVFAAVFDDAVLEMDPHARRRPLPGAGGDDQLVPVPGKAHDDADGAGLPWATLPAVTATADASDSAFAVPERLPAEVAGLADTPFEQLSPPRCNCSRSGCDQPSPSGRPAGRGDWPSIPAGSGWRCVRPSLGHDAPDGSLSSWCG